MANGWRMRPTTPPIMRSGMNAAISERVIDRTVKMISFAPVTAARRGGTPAAMWRSVLSATTTASSTTSPTDRVSASRVILSSDSPSPYIAAKVDTMETGTITPATSVVVRRPRHR